LQIDLFTFIAQIVNFLILVALLRIFLYKRIIQAMDERKRKIAERMDEAQAKQNEAEEKAESYERRKEQIQAEKEKMLSQAREDAGAERKELMKEARREVEQSREKWQESILRQRKSFAVELRRRSGEQVCRISRKVLKELADGDLELQAAKIFLKRLKDLSGKERENFFENIGDSDKLVLRSAFDLPRKWRDEIEETLKEAAAGNTELDFKVSQDLICGIELDAGGRKISWSIDSYLESLEESIAGVFDRFETEEPEDEVREKSEAGEEKEEKAKKEEKKGKEKEKKEDE